MGVSFFQGLRPKPWFKHVPSFSHDFPIAQIFPLAVDISGTPADLRLNAATSEGRFAQDLHSLGRLHKGIW